MDEEAEAVTVTGQVIHCRSLSKKLVFYDMRRTDAHDGPTHIELVVKLDVYGDVAAVQHVRDTVHLGDIVQVGGTLDEAGSLRVTSLTNLARWADTHTPSPDKPGGPQFVPDQASITWWAEQYAKRNSGPESSMKQHHAGGKVASRMPAGVAAAAAVLHSRGEPHRHDSQAHDAQEVSTSGSGAADANGGLRICKFFLNTGRCARGDLCAFMHVAAGAQRKDAKRAYLTARKEQRAAGAAAEGFSVHAAGGAAAKRRRAALLARWLVDTYGLEYLNSGTGVLDVAGGRGALTFQLQVMHGVRVTLVEPRPFKLSRFQHKVLARLASGSSMAAVQRGQEGADEDARGCGDEEEEEEQEEDAQEDAGAGAEPVPPSHPPSQPPSQPAAAAAAAAAAASQPQQHFSQVRAWFTEALWRRAVEVHAHDATTSPQQHQALATGAAVQGLGGAQASHPDPGPAITWPGGQLVGEELARALHTIAHASVVVGLHPDQATEEIWSYANAGGVTHDAGGTPRLSTDARRPFVIVPCCVFGRLFPHRRVRVPATPAAEPLPAARLPHGGSNAAGVSGTGSAAAEGASDSRGGSWPEAGAPATTSSMWEAPTELLRQTGRPAAMALPDHPQEAHTVGPTQAVSETWEPVVSYPMLVEYLVQQGGPGTHVQVLPFEGANKVVFRK